MTGAGLDLISACLAVFLFNLAVCLSYGVLLLVSVPMDETFSAATILQIAYMSLKGVASVESTSHLHRHDLNDAKHDCPSVLPLWSCDCLSAGFLTK